MTKETTTTTGRDSSSGVGHHPKQPKKNNVEPSNIIIHIDPGKARAKFISRCNAELPLDAERARSIYLEKIEISAAAEERRRTGRYLAVGVTLVMLFIACYHILMRQMPVLVGLLAPAIIMILYVLWLLYFAKKRRRTQITLV